MAATFAPEIMEKVKHVTSLPYAEQAKFYLNAFWREGAEEEAETVWSLCEAFEKEDNVKGKNGNELNPIQAFHLLQQRNETLTALELKAQLRKVDIDANGEMALAEYLLFINNRDPIRFVTNPQGDLDPAELKAAEDRVEQLNKAFDDLIVQLDNQKKTEAAAKAAEAEAVRTEAAAKDAEQVAVKEEAAAKTAADLATEAAAKALAAENKAKAEEAAAVDAENKAKADEEAAVKAEADSKVAAEKAKVAEAELRKVEEEARQVDAELKAQQDAFDAEINRLTALTTDDTAGIVKRNKAVQELAQLKGSDPMPLKKAKITQEAVVRRVARAAKAAEEESKAAQVAAVDATEKRHAAADAAAKAQAAREQAVAARKQAEADRAAADEAERKAKEALALAQQRRAEAVAAREQAEADLANAKAKRAEAEEATRKVEQAVADIKVQISEAEVALQELKSKSGSPQGAIWWAERIIIEKKKYLPTRFQ